MGLRSVRLQHSDTGTSSHTPQFSMNGHSSHLAPWTRVAGGGLTRKLVMDRLLLVLVLDVILEDCAVDLHGLVMRVQREVVQTNSEAKCPHGGLGRASPFTEALGVNPTQDSLAQPCRVDGEL